MIGSGDRVVALPFARLEHSDGLVVLGLDTPGCVPLQLTGSGARVWRTLAHGSITTGDLVASLAAESGLSPLDIDADVRQFLASLVDHGLVAVEKPFS